MPALALRSRLRPSHPPFANRKSVFTGWVSYLEREASAFGLHELAIVALGQVTKDRAVQGRVGSLATGLLQ